MLPLLERGGVVIYYDPNSYTDAEDTSGLLGAMDSLRQFRERLAVVPIEGLAAEHDGATIVLVAWRSLLRVAQWDADGNEQITAFSRMRLTVTTTATGSSAENPRCRQEPRRNETTQSGTSDRDLAAIAALILSACGGAGGSDDGQSAVDIRDRPELEIYDNEHTTDQQIHLVGNQPADYTIFPPYGEEHSPIPLACGITAPHRSSKWWSTRWSTARSFSGTPQQT